MMSTKVTRCYFSRALISLLVFTFSTSSAFASPEVSQAQFITSYVGQIQKAKTMYEYVDSVNTVPKDIREEIKAWVKAKGGAVLPKVSSHDPDVSIEMDGKKAKLTFTDYKRHLLSLNDEQLKLDENLSVAENLNRILSSLTEKKSVSLSLFPQAQAQWQLPAVLIGGVALIGILGYAYLYPGTATGRAKNLISKASDANVAALNLDCAPDTDSHTPKRIVLRRLGKNLDTRVNRMEEQIIVNYTPDNGDSTNFALGKIEALRQDIDRSGTCLNRS